eukprot:scaffold1621_cov117-Cyclotella_meneghiniana.AAC.4
MAVVIGIVLIPQSAAGLEMKGLQGVTVDEKTSYDEDAGHATFKGTIDQGDNFGNDIKLGHVVDEEKVPYHFKKAMENSRHFFDPKKRRFPCFDCPPCYCENVTNSGDSYMVEMQNPHVSIPIPRVDDTDICVCPPTNPNCECKPWDWCNYDVCTDHGFKPSWTRHPTQRPTRRPTTRRPSKNPTGKPSPRPRPRPRPKADKWKNTIHADEIDLKEDIPSDCLGSNYDVELAAFADEDEGAHFVLTAKVSTEQKSLDYKCPDFLTFASIDGKKYTHRVHDSTKFNEHSSFLLGRASLKEIMNAESSVAAIRDS